MAHKLVSEPIVKIKYEYRDDCKWHCFVGNDEFSLGLCIASKDLVACINDIQPCLKYLLKQNHGIDFDGPVQWEVS